MDFILNLPEGAAVKWTPENICKHNAEFESQYRKWIVGNLSAVHANFSAFVRPDFDSPTPGDSLARQYEQCWGSPDEIFVIMGAKLMLEGQAHVLGETMLLRKLAIQHGLSPDFVCWCHHVSFPKKEAPEEIEPIQNLLYLGSVLFETHRDAFMSLCHYLEGQDYIPLISPGEFYPKEEEEEDQEEAAAAGPIPIFPED
jgi:hypothetical protein